MKASQSMPAAPKPIAAIFTAVEHVPPSTLLQQLDEAGIHKVYILLTTAELEQAAHDVYQLLDWGQTANVLDHYRAYLPAEKAHISFEFVDTEHNHTDEGKIRYFLDHVNADNLVNICFTNDHELKWEGKKLFNEPHVAESYTTTLQVFGKVLFEKKSIQIPSIEQRSAHQIMVDLLHQDKPLFFHKNEDMDIVNHQGLLQTFVDMIKLQIVHDKSDYASQVREQLSYFVEMYTTLIKQSHRANVKFEASHSKRYHSLEHQPGLFEQNKHQQRMVERHQRLVEKKMNAELAFPELIRNMVSIYRELLQHQEIELSAKNNIGYPSHNPN